jgi:hypothetical protein
MIDNWLFYPVAAIAILLTGISKSGFGGGLGALSVPIMALVIPPTKAAGILLPLLCFMDIFSFWHYRRKWDKRNIQTLLPAAFVGILLGAFLFKYLTDSHIRILVGLLSVVFGAYFFLQKERMQPHKPNVAKGRILGAISGFISFGIHAGGPPVSMYLLPQNLDKSVFVGTTVAFFTVVNYVKLIPYGLLGQLNTGNLGTSLLMAPLAPAGIFLGIKLHGVIQHKLFYNICYGGLFLTGIKLLYDGVKAL